MTVILLTCIFNSMHTPKRIPLEKLAEIADVDLIITHSLPLHFNADDLNINDLNVCILKGNFKDNKRKLTELKLLLILNQ